MNEATFLNHLYLLWTIHTFLVLLKVIGEEMYFKSIEHLHKNFWWFLRKFQHWSGLRDYPWGSFQWEFLQTWGFRNMELLLTLSLWQLFPQCQIMVYLLSQPSTEFQVEYILYSHQLTLYKQLYFSIWPINMVDSPLKLT